MVERENGLNAGPALRSGVEHQLAQRSHAAGNCNCDQGDDDDNGDRFELVHGDGGRKGRWTEMSWRLARSGRPAGSSRLACGVGGPANSLGYLSHGLAAPTRGQEWSTVDTAKRSKSAFILLLFASQTTLAT